MIFTQIEHLIIEDLPINLSNALSFLIYNRNSLTHITENMYFKESFQIEYLDSYSLKDKSYWQSHRKYIYIYTILKGEEIIDIANINNLLIYKNYQFNTDTILYTGTSQSRIRLQKNDIIIIFPEEAYRTHYIPEKLINKLLLKIPIT